MDNFLAAIISTFVVSSISFIGIFLLLKKLKSDSFFITFLISFAAGALLGDVFIHLMPEYIETYSFSTEMTLFILLGILFMLTVEAIFHSQHEHNKESNDDRRPFLARLNLLGDGIHNFLDGIAIGVSFLISIEVGVLTTIAVILHEIPQELADTSVLIYSGWKRKKILFANFLIGLTSVFGVIVVMIGERLIEGIEIFLIPFAVGQFLYISLATLIPEIHRSSEKKRYIYSLIAFCFGILIMFSLNLFE